jgi:hypothetical protein
MIEHRYILEPYKGMSSRYRCPACKHRNKTFSLYIDTETGEHLNPSVGRCNRIDSCTYHYTPKQYFKDNNISFDTPQYKEHKHKPIEIKQKTVSLIPVDVFKASLKAHDNNHFVKYLIDLFGNEIAGNLVKCYFIGTSKRWNGATVFWQIDNAGKVRTGKIMLYNPLTGKRIKEPYNCIDWAHKHLKQSDFDLKQCFYGQHLLIDKSKPVAIVESEKTALIASVYLPAFIWLAVGSLEGLNPTKCQALQGRNVSLFPDLNGFKKWSDKAKELSNITSFNVSDLLERKASEAERKNGLDLADYLVRFNYKDFNTPKHEPLKAASRVEPIEQLKDYKLWHYEKQINEPERPEYENWERDITELEDYFEKTTMPANTFKLNQCSMITDCTLFVKSHISIIKANNGKKTFISYLNRLQQFKTLL